VSDIVVALPPFAAIEWMEASTVRDLRGSSMAVAARGELELLVETTAAVVHCHQCGGRAQGHDRREHLLRDVPVAGRAAVLVWWKRIWRCTDPAWRHPAV
jgi:hypothetical protein